MPTRQDGVENRDKVYYSEAIQRKDRSKEKNNKNLPISDEKCTLKTNLTDDVMSHFWSFQKLLSRTLLSCRVIKRRLSAAFGLVSRLFRFAPLKF